MAGARWRVGKTPRPAGVSSQALRAPAGAKASVLLASLHTSSGSAWRRAPGAESRCRRCRPLAGLPEMPLSPPQISEPLTPTLPQLRGPRAPNTPLAQPQLATLPAARVCEDDFRPLCLWRTDSVVTPSRTRTRTLSRPGSRLTLPL